MKIKSKYRKTADLYRYFGREWEHCMDFSEDALVDIFLFETTGKGTVKPDNGYATH